MDIKSIQRNSAASEAGQWVTDIPGMDDVRLRVRGLSSPTVVAIRARKERKVSRDGRERDGSLKPDVGMRIFGEVLHEAVLMDWDGFTDNGEPVSYDADLAKEWLTSPDFMPFADAVTWAAQVVDKGMAEAQEDLEKNSGKSSRGRSSGATKQTT